MSTPTGVTGATEILKLCGKGKGISLTNVYKQRITFAAATTGEIASKELFAVTGTILACVIPVCQSSLTSGGAATIQVGTSADTLFSHGNISFDSLDAGFVWVTGDAGPEVQLATARWFLTTGYDIGYQILAATITGGIVDFYLCWIPISEDALVEAAGSNVVL